MGEQVPSKERCNCPNGSYGIKHTTLCYEEQLVAARRTAEYWKAEHLAGNAEIDRLRKQVARLKQYICVTALAGYRCAPCAERLAPKPAHEREPPHCSTCGCGLAPEPAGE